MMACVRASHFNVVERSTGGGGRGRRGRRRQRWGRGVLRGEGGQVLVGGT